MADQLTTQQYAECKEAFRQLDYDNTGYIDRKKLHKTMVSLGQAPTPEDLTRMISEADANGDGVIDFQEFMNMAVSKFRRHRGNMIKMRDAFLSFDKDGDGVIDPQELKNVLEQFGEQIDDDEIQRMFSEVDIDGNGFIEFEEFVKLMKSL
ncbi:calmodulin mutant SYNCAM64A [Basidiobolus meristosporus CBS 931.73]|uniref:Calmodulin mutant SYNCAM64A n=1 Tax=Basidiobolus meristosporus CBS 931.73 TaxID=1314790 RepID=A0A1Y1Y423_9FUNG|nr:calmodulin mutant SYNCAM64A [Basidiobolus meristosporus CBS 931.73]|eukprot:ORX92738.1 calmodulin mutant SYNCAM64A [Basidiobolus meristosporus CBS 931.73]